MAPREKITWRGLENNNIYIVQSRFPNIRGCRCIAAGYRPAQVSCKLTDRRGSLFTQSSASQPTHCLNSSKLSRFPVQTCQMAIADQQRQHLAGDFNVRAIWDHEQTGRWSFKIHLESWPQRKCKGVSAAYMQNIVFPPVQWENVIILQFNKWASAALTHKKEKKEKLRMTHKFCISRFRACAPAVAKSPNGLGWVAAEFWGTLREQQQQRLVAVPGGQNWMIERLEMLQGWAETL